MWESEVETLRDGRVRRVVVLLNGERLLYSEVVGLWQRDTAFCEFLNSLLSEAPFAAYFWETPPMTSATADQAFEFVLVASSQLARSDPDPRAFESQFASEGERGGVVTFPNLGGDATLVAPCPLGPLSAYPHLAAFAREAPSAQRLTFWKAVGAALENHIATQRIWLSTSGLGVPWVHVRLDSRPKYYQYQPYKHAA
jgi:hypothetical protein